MVLKRTITVIRLGDRHKKLHERQFADCRSVTVEDESLPNVVYHALLQIGFESGARFSILVEEPHE